jgi:hypothetical protein
MIRLMNGLYSRSFNEKLMCLSLINDSEIEFLNVGVIQ